MVLLPDGAGAQRLPVGDPLEHYLRILQVSGSPVSGSLMVRPMGPDAATVGRRGALAAGPWRDRMSGGLRTTPGPFALTLADPWLRFFASSSHPSGRNDGVVWQGKGITGALDVGFTAEWGPLSVTALPTLVFTQNASFALAAPTTPGAVEYSYPWYVGIDLPQRFGPDEFWTLDPGQSAVRLSLGGAVAGFGTESLWWGPGVRDAILMSNNAPGFPHAFIGTGRPVDVGFGRLEARWIWGRLGQSEWFDPTFPTTRRFLTGAVFAISPDALPGLSLGAARVFYAHVPTDGVGAGEWFLVFQRGTKKTFVTPENPTGEDDRDQLFSAFARWVLPESGFEAYVEWARNDHFWNLTDLVLEPEHSQGYTLGFQKVVARSRDRLVGLRGELTHLERSTTYQVRPAPSYYTHFIVRQGYTQRGQVIGAGIGPGGNAQFLGVDLFETWGRAAAFVERRVRDNDAYYAHAVPAGLGFCCHDVSLETGAEATLFIGDFDLEGGAIVGRELNRYFVEGNHYWYLRGEVSARWRPR